MMGYYGIEQFKEDGSKGISVRRVYGEMSASLREYECIKIPNTKNEWEYMKEELEIFEPFEVIE